MKIELKLFIVKNISEDILIFILTLLLAIKIFMLFEALILTNLFA